jgi:phage baseplate assembly protein gpV
MHDAVGIIRAIVRDQLRSLRTAELGTVTAVYPHEGESDLNNYECDVKLRDSGLELKRVAVGTSRVGFAAIPNQDDLVLLHFINGDVHDAVITARLYNDTDRQPRAAARECVYISPDQPESGVRRLYLELPNGNKLLLDDDKLVLEMGQTKLTVNHDGDLVIDSNAKLTVTTQGDASLEAHGNIELKTTSGSVTIEGSSVTVRGTSGATLDGGPSTTVRGGTISIAGKTDFSPA